MTGRQRFLADSLVMPMVAMTRRRLLLPSLVCLVAVVAYVVWPRPSQFNAAAAAKVEVGMDLATVETILGGPARDESTGPLATADSKDDATGKLDLLLMRAMEQSGGGWPLPVTQEWVSDSVIIHIGFVNGRAGVPEVVPVRRVHETPWATLRRWLKLP
jgi:hypothetical protein